MREIKFRAYDGMDWVYGTAVDYEKETDTYYMFIDDKWIMVGKVSQYTGMKDKNGVEIYEGDIIPKEVVIRKPHQNGGYTLVGFKTVNMQVKFDEESYYYTLSNGEYNYPFYMWKKDIQNGTVIGNVYENHEFLEYK